MQQYHSKTTKLFYAVFIGSGNNASLSTPEHISYQVLVADCRNRVNIDFGCYDSFLSIRSAIQLTPAERLCRSTGQAVVVLFYFLQKCATDASKVYAVLRRHALKDSRRTGALIGWHS